MPKVKFYTGIDIPLEFHRARIVQKVKLLPIDERLEALKKGGFNTYRMDSARMLRRRCCACCSITRVR